MTTRLPSKWTDQKFSQLAQLISNKGKHFYIDGKQIVFPEEVNHVLQDAMEHLPPNVGIHKAFSYIQPKYTGITREQIFDFLKRNKYYQEFHQRRNPSHSKPIIQDKPGHEIIIDYSYMPPSVPFQGRSYKGFLLIVDAYSKLVSIKPIPGDETAEKDAAALKEFLDSEWGKNVRLARTDNGSNFHASFHDLLTERGIKHIYSSTSTPQSQGLAERNNQTAKRWLYAWSKQKYGNFSSWVKLVKDVEHAINNTVQASTKKTPIQLFREGTNQSVVQRMKDIASRRYYSRVYQENKLKPGDKVLLSLGVSASTPFSIREAIAKRSYKIYKPQWDVKQGPFTVEAKYGDQSYYLKELQGRYDRAQLLKVPSVRPVTEATKPLPPGTLYLPSYLNAD